MVVVAVAEAAANMAEVVAVAVAAAATVATGVCMSGVCPLASVLSSRLL